MSFSYGFKSCILLASIPYNIPSQFLTQPPDIESDTMFTKFGFLEDSFKVVFFKPTDSILRIEIYRKWKNPEEKHDDGYDLRIFTTLTGSDEKTKVAIMSHIDEMVSTDFALSDDTMIKAQDLYYFFNLFVVVQMLEFESLSIGDSHKFCMDGFMANLKSLSKDTDVEHLSYILKSPGLEDAFTGRHPYSHVRYIFLIISEMSRDYSKYAKYLKDKSEGVKPDADVRGLLIYLGRMSKERPLSQRSIIDLYIKAQKLGLEFFKIITSDFLLQMMKADSTFILDVLGVAVLVQDQDLIDEVIIPFLSNFHEIVRSEKFEEFSKYKGSVLRLIMHTIRMWMTNNDVEIPGWKMSTLPTTEL